MIAAVGRFETGPLLDALRLMAANANADYDHELRGEGEALQHDCGWGVAFREGDTLTRRRSASSCLEDPEFDALSGLKSNLIILHARRTPDRSTIDVRNSHPFVERWLDEQWVFCHNGAVEDLGQLSSDDGLAPSGTVDSELLFHHVLTRMDVRRVPESLASILGEIHAFTCLNCFLATPGRVVAHARVSPETTRPRYYQLWRAEGDGFSLVSSETFSVAGASWSPVPDGTAFTMVP
jgi:predicted glutamine amidotransferase